MEERRREAELLPGRPKKEDLGGYKDAYQRSDAARALRYPLLPLLLFHRVSPLDTIVRGRQKIKGICDCFGSSLLLYHTRVHYWHVSLLVLLLLWLWLLNRSVYITMILAYMYVHVYMSMCIDWYPSLWCCNCMSDVFVWYSYLLLFNQRKG